MRTTILILFLLSLAITGRGQSTDRLSFWQPADSLHPGRLRLGLIGGGAAYGVGAVGLYFAWYRGYDLTGFHTFDDWPEWERMDKIGHLMTTYAEARLIYAGARWTGMSPVQARWTAGFGSLLLQSTIEVMDGFSSRWGFSWYDMGFNVAGAGAFVLQDWLWEEQRILLKVSNTFAPYHDVTLTSTDQQKTIPFRQWGRSLYGTTPFERFIKDYDAQTLWASVNPRSFLPNAPWPRWLNLAVGYGAANVYGAYANSWLDEEGRNYWLPADAFPRHRQYYLATDIDLSRLPVRKPWLRTVLGALNFIRIPGPALEWSKEFGFKFHPFYL